MKDQKIHEFPVRVIQMFALFVRPPLSTCQNPALIPFRRCDLRVCVNKTTNELSAHQQLRPNLSIRTGKLIFNYFANIGIFGNGV